MDDAPPILLRATCRLEHTWDVWASEVEGNVVVDTRDLLCPFCESTATSLVEPDSLA